MATSKDITNTEFRGMFNSVLFAGGNRCSKFPVCRPTAGAEILVFSEGGQFMGQGVGSECKNTGGSITINGKKFDSNHTLHWCGVT